MRIMRFLLIVFLISIIAEAKDFKGAEFRTKNTFRYGRFEVSMKSANREGVLSSFFTYYDNLSGINEWNEIDIEILGRYSKDIQFNTITPGQTNHASHFPLKFSPHTDYHTYAFEWTPAYVAWFVDGVEVYRQTGSHIQTLTKPQKIMMNIWNPTYPNWVGVFNPDVLPAFAYYDWVAYYAWTPGTGNYGTDNNFTFSWRDDFDFWNTSRWDKGTHTWDGNGCDFIVENAVIQNSKLILCLTNDVNIGFTDVKQPQLLAARVLDGKVVCYFSEEMDSVTAVNKANYNIVGATVTGAKLLYDSKSVELTVSGWDFVTAKNLLVLNIKDRVGNTMIPRALNITLQNPVSFPLKINCAGSAALGYFADQEWGINKDYGYFDGATALYSSGIQINGTDEDEIFRSERYNQAMYRIVLPAGIYRVKLMFAENYFNQAGQRIFDVFVQQEKMIQDLDVFAQAGGMQTALIKEVNNVSVTDGFLEISFGAKINSPMINGIQVELISTGVNDESPVTPDDFRLMQNYPNPFNGQTKVSFTVNKPGEYRLLLHNLLGEKVLEKNFGLLNEGSYSVNLDMSEIGNSQPGSGIYFYSLSNGQINETRKLMLLN